MNNCLSRCPSSTSLLLSITVKSKCHPDNANHALQHRTNWSTYHITIEPRHHPCRAWCHSRMSPRRHKPFPTTQTTRMLQMRRLTNCTNHPWWTLWHSWTWSTDWSIHRQTKPTPTTEAQPTGQLTNNTDHAANWPTTHNRRSINQCCADWSINVAQIDRSMSDVMSASNLICVACEVIVEPRHHPTWPNDQSATNGPTQTVQPPNQRHQPITNWYLWRLMDHHLSLSWKGDSTDRNGTIKFVLLWIFCL